MIADVTREQVVGLITGAIGQWSGVSDAQTGSPDVQSRRDGDSMQLQ
jgi:hypothetical protein